ncbi:MAG: SGNH/GDSL hydrolase family protein [Deltaproteobacteria bacterium]|nr:SGNH/GDSL hydrolase family protein [Deltaproteobacteria bacterium]
MGRGVLLLGDSFTEGQGVVESETFARRLEAALGVRVYNGGRRGRDLPGLVERLERLLPLARPAIAVYAFMLNDFEQTPDWKARQTFLNDLVLDRQHMGEPGWKLPGWLRWSRLAVFAAERVRSRDASAQTIEWYRGMTGPANAAGWARTRADLAAMDRSSRDAGARLLVAVLPLLFELDDYPFRGLHRDITAACAELSIEAVDLLPAFEGAEAETLWVHPIDRHPNGRAHAWIAAALADKLRGMLAEPRP